MRVSSIITSMHFACGLTQRNDRDPDERYELVVVCLTGLPARDAQQKSARTLIILARGH